MSSADERWTWFQTWGLKRSVDEAKKLANMTRRSWVVCEVASSSKTGREAKRRGRRAYHVIAAAALTSNDKIVKIYHPGGAGTRPSALGL